MPSDVELLSLQISKLPRDAFGHGLPPSERPLFVDSWVVGSGTGIYGTFSLDESSTLLLQEDASSLLRFVDDHGRDLIAIPEKDPPNPFFDGNKTLQIETFPEKKLVTFTLRGHEVPTRGATSLEATARIVFLSLSEEQTAEHRIVKLESGTDIHVGPVAMAINDKENQLRKFPPRTSGPLELDNVRWALAIGPRAKPFKSIEFLDADDRVVAQVKGPKFDGKKYTQWLQDPDVDTATVRVTWYEKVELIAIPLKISTPLSL